MDLRTGIDIVDFNKFAKNLENNAFLRKVFTLAEIEECEQSVGAVVCFARKFAIKEAAMKAIGRGIRDEVWFLQIEILGDEISFHAKAQGVYSDLGEPDISVSVSIDGNLVVATVILQK